MTLLSSRGGSTLLEVLCALVIVSVAGSSLVASIRSGIHLVQQGAAAETRLESANRILSWAILLNRLELERRMGSSRVDEFQVSVQRPEATLFRIGIAYRDDPEHEVLTTVVFRAREERR